MEDFTDDIITEILTRLPAKNVHRFKSVSKRWYSIIRNPLFVTSYIAHNAPTSFYIVDRDILLSPPHSVAGRVDLTPNPNVSYFYANQTRLLSPHEIIPFYFDEFDLGSPDIVLQYDRGLSLICLVCNRDPNTQTRNLQFERDWDNSLFVCNVITHEWVRIPPPPFPISNRLGTGFITRVKEGDHPGVVSKFVICNVQLVGLKDKAMYLMMCFSSDTGKWVVKEIDSLHNYWPASPFAYNGRLYWVDTGNGIIVWDDYPFSASENVNKAACRLIRFPEHVVHAYTLPILDYKYGVGVSGGYIQLAEMIITEDALLKLWRLSDTENWVLLYQVSRVDVETYMYKHLKIAQPTVCFLHPFDVDVVFFDDDGHIFSYNFRTQKVVSVAMYAGNGHCLPVVLPAWPTSIPPRLYAAYAKEEGDEFRRDGNFNEAISSYSKSINLSPCVPAYANRALAYLKVGRFKEAEADCTYALSLDGHCRRAYVQRAIARKELGNLQGSMADIEYALKLEPNNQDLKKL